MKKMLLNLADHLLSTNQMKTVKGGYDGTASNGSSWNPSGSEGQGGYDLGTNCIRLSYWPQGWVWSATDCPPGAYK